MWIGRKFFKQLSQNNMKKINKVLYFHRKPDGEIFYIGIGTIKRAHSKHGRTKWWHNIADKYGYKIEIIYENLLWWEACELEKFCIKEIGRLNIGTGTLINLTEGGEGTQGYSHSTETREKISKNHARIWKGKKMPDEMREKFSKSHIGIQAGEKHPLFGKHHNNETKKKIGDAHRGMRHSEETIKKMSEVKKGKIKTKEHRKALSNSLTGKKKTEEHKKHLSESHKGKVFSEETRKKLSIAKTGIKYSEESKNKIRNFKKEENRKKGFKVSEYMGLRWNNQANRWHVFKYYNGKDVYIGSFKEGDEIEAAKAYDKFAVEKFGLNSLINFPIQKL